MLHATVVPQDLLRDAIMGTLPAPGHAVCWPIVPIPMLVARPSLPIVHPKDIVPFKQIVTRAKTAAPEPV